MGIPEDTFVWETLKYCTCWQKLGWEMTHRKGCLQQSWGPEFTSFSPSVHAEHGGMHLQLQSYKEVGIRGLPGLTLQNGKLQSP